MYTLQWIQSTIKNAHIFSLKLLLFEFQKKNKKKSKTKLWFMLSIDFMMCRWVRLICTRTFFNVYCLFTESVNVNVLSIWIVVPSIAYYWCVTSGLLRKMNSLNSKWYLTMIVMFIDLPPLRRIWLNEWYNATHCISSLNVEINFHHFQLPKLVLFDDGWWTMIS